MPGTAAQTKRYRDRYPNKRRQWDANYRKTEAAKDSHQNYNESEKGKAKAAGLNLKYKYGKTLAEKQEQYDKQHGLCGLCQKPLPVNLSKCHWDHNHVTGEMRDVLHSRCNVAVGFFECNLMKGIEEYIKRHSNVQ